MLFQLVQLTYSSYRQFLQISIFIHREDDKALYLETVSTVQCCKEIWKVGKVGRVGKVGKVGEVGKVGLEGLFMPTWSQL